MAHRNERSAHSRHLDACPSCGSPEVHSARLDLTYERVHPPTDPHQAVVNFYLTHLFDTPRFRLTQDLCPRCGLLFANPTYTDEELLRAYTADSGEARAATLAEYLSTGAVDPSPSAEALAESDERRARWVFRRVRRRLDGEPGSWRVLDFGGKDGAMLAPFLRAGSRGYLHDLAPSAEAAPDVVYVEAPGKEEPFDAVLLCHTLEHVVEPRRVLETIRALLRPGGVLYVEVPCDLDQALVRGNPGPLTHVNVFGPSSLRNALAVAGFEPLWTRLVTSSYRAIPLLSLSCVARPARPAERPPAHHSSRRERAESWWLGVRRTLDARHLVLFPRM